MKWKDRQRPIEHATKKEIADVYYDWDCAMYYAFNGRPYPKDYPRSKQSISFTYRGSHMAFNDLKNYIKKHKIEVEE